MSKEIMHGMLQDIVTHFSRDPEGLRSTLGTGSLNECLYYPNLKHTPNSIGCAIGMYIDWKTAKKMDEYGVIDKVPSDMLPKWMRNLDIDFLRKCQRLHDFSDNWGDNGLTKEGKSKVNSMCKKYGLKQIKFK